MKNERGFTMTELMVTVGIIGVLASVATAVMRTDRVGDRARAVAGILQEARRRAVATGPIRADVATATGLTARTQVILTTDETSSRVELWELVEDPPPASSAQWASRAVVSMPPDRSEAIIWAVAGGALTDPSGTEPDQMSGSVTRSCYPSGVCDGMTVYLARRDARHIGDGDHYRIVVFPVSGIPTTSKGW